MRTLAVHPNDMSAWPEIACQRGHIGHETRRVRVDLWRPHLYHDYPQVPNWFARSFTMSVFDWTLYRGGPGGAEGYCPGRDAVSETIAEVGIWEPAETILTLAVCSSQPGRVVDLGAQIGWFSLLALSCGCEVTAVDADDEPLLVLMESAEANGWAGELEVQVTRYGPGTEPEEARAVRLLKIDLEGAEGDAVRAWRPALEAGLVDHLLVEISPVFGDYYPAMVADLMAMDYVAYRLPEKSLPPARLVDPERDLARLEDPAEIAGWHQANLWLRRGDASW